METISLRNILEEVNQAVNKEEVHIQPTAETPEVILNKNEGRIKFRGRSMPQDAKSFYTPLLEWLVNYKEKPAPGTQVTFEYEYFNTASSKMIMEIIMELNAISEKDRQFKAEWHYIEDDEDMFDAGKDYEEMTGISFNFCCYS